MYYVLIDSNGVAIAADDVAPTQFAHGVEIDGCSYFGAYTISQVAMIPADFVGGKYRLNATADGLEPNPAYVAPSAPALVSFPALTITAITPDAAHSAVIAPGFSEVTCQAGTTLTVSASLSVPVSGTFRMPLVSSDGRERFVLVTLTAGVATFDVPLTESGLWSVTEANINRDLPSAAHMAFAGIKVWVTL